MNKPATIPEAFAVLEGAHLVVHDEELVGRVTWALDFIASRGDLGIQSLLERLYRGLVLVGSNLEVMFSGDEAWNEWLKKQAVVKALSRARAESAVPELIPLLHAECRFADFYQILQPWVARTLGEIGDARAIGPLHDALSNDQTRMATKKAIGEALQKLEGAAPGDPALILAEADSLFKSGKQEEVLQTLEQIDSGMFDTLSAQDKYYLWYMRGEVHARMKDTEKAVECFRTSLKYFNDPTAYARERLRELSRSAQSKKRNRTKSAKASEADSSAESWLEAEVTGTLEQLQTLVEEKEQKPASKKGSKGKPENIVEVEADSLEEARKRIKAVIPTGLHLLSEEVISDGTPQTIKAFAETVEKAFAKAEEKIPADAHSIVRKETNVPGQGTLMVDAFDEQDAKSQVTNQLGDSAVTESIRLVTPGKTGFLGIGRKPDQYEVTCFQQAVVEVTYQQRVKISARIGKLKRPMEDKEILKDAERENRLVNVVCEHCGRSCKAFGQPLKQGEIMSRIGPFQAARYCPQCNIVVCGGCTGVGRFDVVLWVSDTRPCPRCKGNTIYAAAPHLRRTRTTISGLDL